MELFLNLLWLLLAVPAVWVWRRETFSSSGPHRLSSLRCLLVLSCTLMLLFPFVSATDDLHSMRPEMEESTSSKRVVKLTASSSPIKLSSSIPPAAQLGTTGAFFFDDEVYGRTVTPPAPFTKDVPASIGTGRSPPAYRLS
jgi:hypothetical protein